MFLIIDLLNVILVIYSMTMKVKKRYDKIKTYLLGLNMKIIIDDYIETNRWFIIHAIKQ